VPASRSRYLADIADTVRGYKRRAAEQARVARERQSLAETKRMLAERCYPEHGDMNLKAAETIDILAAERDAKLDSRSRKLLEMWPRMREAYGGDEYVVKIRGKEVRTALTYTSLSGSKIRKVALPRFEDHGELLRWLLLENVPGSFPYTAGVFAFKRENEDPTRMFAGEGDPFRTNRRFKMPLRGLARQAPVDGLRLGDALRQRPGPAPGHLREGRQTAACRLPRSTTSRCSTRASTSPRPRPA